MQIIEGNEMQYIFVVVIYGLEFYEDLLANRDVNQAT